MRSTLIVGLLLALSLPAIRAQQPVAVDGIVAIVGDNIITKKDIEYPLLPAIQLLVTQYGNNPDEFNRRVASLRRERVEDLVANKLILMDFTNTGYNLPESFIDDRVQERIRQDYYGDRVKLTKTLEEDGVSMEQYRKRIRENLIVTFLRDKHVRQQLIISPFKIEQHYQTNHDQFKMEDQVKMRMIQLSKNKDDPQAAGKLAADIAAKLDAGTSFTEMASVYSESAKRVAGGDYGWIERVRSGLRKEITDVAFALKAGQHSQPIITPDAYYIVLVEEVKPAHVRSLSEVRAEIEKALLAREQARLQKQWIDRLKNKFFVQYFID
jgi:peptidyl-prolyl cis-trans isomerase SurA